MNAHSDWLLLQGCLRHGRKLHAEVTFRTALAALAGASAAACVIRLWLHRRTGDGAAVAELRAVAPASSTTGRTGSRRSRMGGGTAACGCAIARVACHAKTGVPRVVADGGASGWRGICGGAAAQGLSVAPVVGAACSKVRRAIADYALAAACIEQPTAVPFYTPPASHLLESPAWQTAPAPAKVG